MAFNWINNDDLNGECFIAGELGEVESLQGNRIVYFYEAHPRATAPFQRVNFTEVQAREFVEAQVKALKHHYGTAATKEYAKIGYYRLLCAKLGLISPAFDTAAFHVVYNEARNVNDAGLAGVMDLADFTQAEVTALTLTANELENLRKNFTNAVCCVAYMFRVRGHHWIADMDAKYKALWNKCQKDGEDCGITWEKLAHDATHAIMPSVLDQFWHDSIEHGRVCGALRKRWDSAPAGVAAIRAVYSGAQDLIMGVPDIRKRFKKEFEDLDNLIEYMRVNRWAGSVNRRFYAAPDVAFDESRFAAIASVIWHALEAFASNSQLLKSAALKRVAGGAPITGGIISKGIATVANDPALARRVLQISDQ